MKPLFQFKTCNAILPANEKPTTKTAANRSSEENWKSKRLACFLLQGKKFGKEECTLNKD